MFEPSDILTDPQSEALSEELEHWDVEIVEDENDEIVHLTLKEEAH